MPRLNHNVTTTATDPGTKKRGLGINANPLGSIANVNGLGAWNNGHNYNAKINANT